MKNPFDNPLTRIGNMYASMGIDHSNTSLPNSDNKRITKCPWDQYDPSELTVPNQTQAPGYEIPPFDFTLTEDNGTEWSGGQKMFKLNSPGQESWDEYEKRSKREEQMMIDQAKNERETKRLDDQMSDEDKEFLKDLERGC